MVHFANIIIFYIYCGQVRGTPNNEKVLKNYIWHSIYFFHLLTACINLADPHR